MPADVARISNAHDIVYTGAGEWTGQTGDEGISPGVEALTDYLLAKYPQILSVGGFSCRAIVGRPTQASVHSTGRALDIMLPVGFRAEANNLEGDPIGNFLVANADALGVQFVIWDRTSWGGHRSPGAKERYYSGAHPHNDHLHVELSEAGGRGETGWLEEGWIPFEPAGQEPPEPPAPPPEEPEPLDELPEEPADDPPEEEPPSIPPTGEQLPEDPQPEGVCAAVTEQGGVVDSDACLWLRGPSNYWQREAGGYNDSLAWTRPVQSGVHQSFAEWKVLLEASGNYQVQVFAEPEFATHRDARYTVHHGTAQTPVHVDLSKPRESSSPWVSLGTFAFDSRVEQKLVLFDNSDSEVIGDARIVADAIRLVPEGEEPIPDPGTGGEPSDPPEMPGTPGQPDDPDGLVTNGCQSSGGKTPWSAALLLLAAALWRHRRQTR